MENLAKQIIDNVNLEQMVLSKASNVKMYVIVVDGHICTFDNRRMWKTKGATRTALTQEIQSILNMCMYNAKFAENMHSRPVLAPLFDWKGLWKVIKNDKRVHDRKYLGEVAKQISQYLIEQEIVKITNEVRA